MHVTVVLGVYNGSSSILQMVESIQNQTYPDWDLLVVDDASTDRTVELVQPLAQCDGRITILRNPVNRGLATCLNLGWRRATGELIARMDVDDVSFPKRLERQVEFILAHPEVDVLGTGAELVDESGRSLGTALRPADHETLAARIYWQNPFIHTTVMMRKRYLTTLNGYDGRLRRAEDFDLWLRGYRRFRFHNLQEALVRYRVRREPLWSEIPPAVIVLMRTAYHERRLLAGSWCSLRYAIAILLTKVGLYDTRLR